MRCRTDGLERTVETDRILRNVTELTLRDFMALYRLAPAPGPETSAAKDALGAAQRDTSRSVSYLNHMIILLPFS